ncbi:protein METABOLIC NETWORK MODULATOR 1 isoform X2 [Corylus avellana]|uniref:protein METABOLIC NETWORK MODULATOR 1 isoform X2 n=1 Tax=Corylus avellana TaxID=13451 RepID=UPI00286BCA84|nr:protein METABOLIC NETWORK MODULATOR 1 isoform X2 [Corylus avellana]
MDQQSQRTSSLSPGDLPMKRKRGRPRKDENPVLGKKSPVTPGSDSVRKNKESAGTSDDVNLDMVGQVVTGVIEGSFDAGYLLNVKVGDTDTQMRGVVFLPGLFTPITAANDVAPHAKMHTRKEIPIPVLNPQTQFHNSVPLSGQSAVKLPKNDTGLSLGGNEAPQQTLEPALETQSAIIMAQPDHDKIVERDELLQECEASTLLKGPNLDTEAAEESKAEPASEPVVVDAVPGIEIVTKELKVQHQDASLNLDPNELVHDEAKNQSLELNQTPVFAEPELEPKPEPETEPISSEQINNPVDTLMEDQASPKEDIAQASLLELRLLNGTPASDPADTTELGSHSTPQTSQLPVIFEGEIIPSESKLVSGMIEPQITSSGATSDPADTTELGSHSTPQTSQLPVISEGEIIPSESKLVSGMIEPQISSSGATSDMEYGIKDVIPSTQS